MLENFDALRTVMVLDENQNPMTLHRSSWLKLSEDIGGLTLVGTFVRTNLLVELEEKEQNA